MSYDVSTLGTYVQPNEKTLLVKAILSAKTIAKIKAKGNVMTGVKSKSQLPQLDTDAVFQDGKACGFTPLGTTKITKREVEVGSIKVNEALCPADVEQTFEQLNLTAGSDYTEVIFASDYGNLKAKKIAKGLEKLVWNGDKTSADANLKRIDGFRKIIKAEASVVNGNTGNVTVATGITRSNIADILDAIYTVIPEDISEEEDITAFVGMEVFRMYILAMRDKNYFKDYNVDGETLNDVMIVGTNMILSATPGLNGTNEIYTMNIGNMWYATDMLNEEEQFDLGYAPEAEEVRFKAKWKSGVQVAFPENIVLFKLKP